MHTVRKAATSKVDSSPQRPHEVLMVAIGALVLESEPL